MKNNHRTFIINKKVGDFIMEENTTCQTITKEEILEKADELKNKACEIHSKVVESIDCTMNTTAEKLDTTAEKLHETAEYLKNKNVSYFQNELEYAAKKHPFKALLSVFGIGFVVGKFILK